MKLKTVEVNGATYAEVQDGKPVFIGDDGSETPIDVAGTRATISRLNAEAKGHREAKEAAQAALKAFDGLDPQVAREAMAKLGDIDAAKLIDAGELDKVKSSLAKAQETELANIKRKFEEQLKEATTRAVALESELYSEKIGGAFARSSYVKDKITLPPDIAQKAFGQHFKLEDGKVVAYDGAGNKIFSGARPGELADFDEALATLVNAYPHKEHVLRGVGASGSGAQGSAGSRGSGEKVLTRSEFNNLSPADAAAKMRSGFKVVDAAQ